MSDQDITPVPEQALNYIEDVREDLEELGEYVSSVHQALVKKIEIIAGELILHTEIKSLSKLLQFLRDDGNCQFKSLIDITAVDYPDREKRFEVVYQLLSYKHNLRIRIKVPAGEEEGVPSVVSLFPAAGWFERETWDMYGIYFTGHPDLRRLLTDYGFEGHPLRKDFPLTGYVEVRYDTEARRVVYEPVTLQQEFRNFDFLSPWEGTDYELPGDEKAIKEKAG